MAAYASTVTLDHPTALRLASNNFKLLSGQCNITNYNQTGAEITGITKFFGGDAPRVISDGFSTNGYMIRWNRTDKCFHAYYPTKAITPTGTNAQVTGTISAGVIAVTAGTAGDAVTNNAGVLESTGGQDLAVAAQTFTGSTPTFTGGAVAAQAGTEVANDVDVGIVNFLAFGV